MDETAATLETTATEATPASEPVSEPAPQVTLDDEGNVSFQEAFWGAVGESASESEPAPDPTPAPEPQPEPAPALLGYTDDELSDIPWEQWDAERITGDVKRYIPILQEQLRRRAAMAEHMRAENESARAPVAPVAAMSNKEIAAAAGKLARERLGLKEEDELDFYDPEHVAALSIAAQEVAGQNRAQVEQQERFTREAREFRAFGMDLFSRTDFPQFNQWVTEKLAAAGMSPYQLTEYVNRTGDIAGVQRTLAGWYQAWRQQKAAPPAPAQARTAPKPPAVETAVGAAAEKKVVDLRNFGELEEADQAKALMDIGLV